MVPRMQPKKKRQTNLEIRDEVQSAGLLSLRDQEFLCQVSICSDGGK